MDLRYVLPPLIKLILPYFLAHPSLSDHQPSLYSRYILLVIKLIFSLLIAILATLFLFFSIHLDLNYRILTRTALPRTALCLRNRNFSVLVATSLLCSVFLSPAHFWMVYPLILCLAPWETLVFNLIKWVSNKLYQTLTAIPDRIIFCITQQEVEDHHPRVEAEAEVEVEVEVEIEAEIDGLNWHAGQEQFNLDEPDDFVVMNIDG